MIKKTLATVLAAATAVCALPLTAIGAHAQPADTGHYIWFKDQLTQTAEKFYTAFGNMYENGDLATGDALYDVTDLVGQDALAGYAAGNTQLLYDMGAARDAFNADNPQLFYVDFSQITLRVTTANGKYFATLGKGRSESYLSEGITASDVDEKISALEAKVNEIVSDAPDGTDREKAVYVHDKIVKETTEYARETEAKAENAPFVHGAYGALVRGESVCEGYAKAYKTIMDALGIPCVTVQGLYESELSGGVQEHMWNCVELDGVWYAVDTTMDDPKGYEPTAEYLLCDGTVLQPTHSADGVMSEANFEFTYPAVCSSLSTGSGEGDPDFTIALDNPQQDNAISYDVTVSYKNMGFAAAKAKGYYFLIDYDGAENWSYIVPEMYGDTMKDTATALSFPVYNNTQSVQFAITTQPMPDQSNGPDLYFKGDKTALVKSATITPGFGSTYYAPPYVYSVTPSNQGTVTPDRDYDVVITYTEELKKTGEIGVDLSSDNQIVTNTSSVKNIVWNESEPKVLKFTFSPSRTYGGDACNYYFDIQGLVGKQSDKAPVRLSYRAKSSAFYGCPHADGWQVYGKPALIADGDMSVRDWTYADGTKVADNVSARISLIASKPADQQSYEDKIKDTGVTPLLSQTYNLTLNLCDRQISQLKDGQRMKIMLPYPDGYDPEQIGTTFKAYHFDKNGNPEEIECFMNEYGIVIFCRSFSPFTVVEVNVDENIAEKKVLVTAGKGGSVSEDLITLSGGKKSVLITPSQGYVIDSITVGSKTVTNFDGSGYTLDLDYDELNQNTTVDVRFVAASVKQTETEAGRTVVVTTAKDIADRLPLPTMGDNREEGDPLDGALIAITVVACVLAAGAAGVATYLVIRDKKSKKKN